LAAWSAPVVMLALVTPSAAAASRPGPEVSLAWDTESLTMEGTVTLIITTPAGQPSSLTTITVVPADSEVTASYDFGITAELSHTTSGNGFVISDNLLAGTEYSVAVFISGNTSSEGTPVTATCESASISLNYISTPP
jgi:hypothetical protein